MDSDDDYSTSMAAQGILARGDRKSFQMDRVILTPGPELEVETVRRIYHLFTQSQLPESHIAKALNNEGRTAEEGRPWTRGIVHEILTNEKYIGNNLYNRTSTKLQTPRIANAPSSGSAATAPTKPSSTPRYLLRSSAS